MMIYNIAKTVELISFPAELRVAFNMLDRNKDGVLSVQELQAMLKTFEIEVPDELVLQLFHNCSHTGI
jgi:Ca2+-binding EF-hand superfamily protein